MAATYGKEYFESAEESGLASLDDVKDLSLLMRLLGIKRGEKVLDVGCGLGRFDGIIAEQGADVTGIDISEYAVEQARRKYKGHKSIRFTCVNALNMEYESYFDKVLCYHLVEHLSAGDGRLLLERIHSALKGKGVLVMGLPINDFTLVRRILRAVTLRPKWGRPSHLTSFSVQEISREISSSGFIITGMYPLSYRGLRLPEGLSLIPFLRQAILCADIRAVKNALEKVT